MDSEKKSTGGQAGFTLMEVLVALVVLTAGLLAIAAFLTQGMQILAGTPTQLAAKEIAATVIDEITVSRDAGDPWLPVATPRNICTGQGENVRCRSFDVTTNVTNNADGIVGLTRVVVTVSYTVSGMRRQYTKTFNMG